MLAINQSIEGELPVAHDWAERDPLNAPGPFYSQQFGCLACGAPEAEAPQLLAELAAETHWKTFFVRQPETSEEVECACRAIEICCIAALRYAGKSHHIIQRLGNNSLYCDFVTDDKGKIVPSDNLTAL